MTHIYVLPQNKIYSITESNKKHLIISAGRKYLLSELVEAFNAYELDPSFDRIFIIDDEQTPLPTNKDAIKLDTVIDHLKSNLEDSKEYWNNGTNKSYIVGWLQQTIVQAIKMLKQN